MADVLSPPMHASDALLTAVMALAGRRIVALTGAGISTESGIPDYRGPVTRHRARNPMRFNQFVGDDVARQRYWARATVGWPRIRDAQPNVAHHALSVFEDTGRLTGVITQNVDGLHRAAGSRELVELHGALREVRCLSCGVLDARGAVHDRFLDENPAFRGKGQDGARDVGSHAPDGDVDLDDELVRAFRVVGCRGCGGALKPRVVFFGENVEPETLAHAWRVFDAANALLVVGSSLEVFSGRRFVEEAARRKWPVVVVNLGPVRRGDLATVHLDGRAGELVPPLVDALSVR